MKVLENRIYRHFKGNNYKVLCVAMHTETQEKMVVYQALYGDYKYFVRPYEMFVSKVDHDKYPDVKRDIDLNLLKNRLRSILFSYLCDLLTYTNWECVIIKHIDKG